MAGIFLQMGKVLDWVPDSMVNLLNQTYWLDPSPWEEMHA
jgi:hypothetical protein